MSLLDVLREIVGRANVLAPSGPDDEYAHDATFMSGSVICTVRPADTAEVSRVVAACAAARTPVVARGAGTSLVGGPVPIGAGVVLSLERLTKLEVDAPNTMAVVGAGVITRALDDAAAAHGLMYPPDPGSIDLSTIGGNVACNAGGMRCVKYGVTADYVVGMTVVLADGRVLQLGGKLRKRASGYRLLQLFIGSEGTLGIVTELIVKLIPRPRFNATAMVGFPSVESAGDAVARVLAAGFFPAAIELMDAGAIELLRDLFPAGFDSGAQAILVVETDGNDEEFVQLELMRLVEVLDGADNRIAQSSSERERLWEARRSFGKVLRAQRHNHFSEDVAVPLREVPEMLRRTAELSRRTGMRMLTVGHAGDGNLHPVLVFEDEQRPQVGAVAAAIFRDALELGGSISAEHGLGALKRDYAEVENGPLALELMRGIKTLLDPAGILNPHKVFPEQPPTDDFLNLIPGWLPAEGESAHQGEIAT